jgi:hypothetical protein
MAEDVQDTTEEITQGSGGGSSAGGTALKAVAAAAAAGAAAVVAKKAFSGGGSSNGAAHRNGGSGGENGGSKSGTLNSIAASGWDAARDAILPAVEEAAGAAGTYLAENGPEVVRERILPRFVESFNEARGG